MTQESLLLQDVEMALSECGWFVMPRRKIWRGTKDWSVWREADPQRFVGVIWRSNTGGARLGRSFVRFGIVGCPDFEGWHFNSGKRAFLEVKTDQGKLTPDQADHLSLAHETGCLGAVVRSYEDTKAWCESLGLRRVA